MLTSAIGDLLPSAIGVALSPAPIIAVILMLGTPKARSNGPAFALGWIVGLVAVSVVVLTVASGADDPDSASSSGVNWVTLGLGVLFLVLASREWRARPKHGEATTLPKWMDTVDHFGAGKALALGLALSAANPKNLALTLAAAGAIAQAGLSVGENAVAVAVFVVLASVTVVGPVAFYLVAGAKADGPLASLKTFMTDHNAVIMMVVLLVLGAKLIGSGLSGVTN
jgi:threonine/homoserine/homoserine lactone efflux protein